jgi:calpain-7
MDCYHWVDPEFRDIQELEQNARSATDKQECLDSIVKAASLCIKYRGEWVEPLGKQELAQKLRYLLDLGEEIKQSRADRLLDSFNLDSLTASLSSYEVRKAPTSSRELSTKEKIIILKGTKFGGAKYAEGSREPTSEYFDQIPPTICTSHFSQLRVSDAQRQHFKDYVRPELAFPPPGVLSKEEHPKPSMIPTQRPDLIQDIGSDCSVVASISAIMTNTESGQQRLRSIFRPYDETSGWPAISKNGQYWLRFYFNGAFRTVIIDDMFPRSKSDRILYIVDSNNPSLLWPALLEKAYLQLWGSYDFLGSNSNTDIFFMTGWIPELVILAE